MMGMNMKNMMKQVQQMQVKMSKLQEELATRTLEATAGGGAVKVTVNGKLEIIEVKIDPAAVDPDDVEMLQDLVLAATNEALRKMQDMSNNEMSKLTGGLGVNIPGLF